jgi:hypothetical protein
MPPYKPAIIRFRSKVAYKRTDTARSNGREGICWIWTGHCNKEGYGSFNAGKRKIVLAHRWSYEHFIGPIPDGKEIDHWFCNNPSCVRPSHLRAVTNVENVRAAPAHYINRTHCKHGHEYTPENTRIESYKTAAGKVRKFRRCKTCRGEKVTPRRVA